MQKGMRTDAKTEALLEAKVEPNSIPNDVEVAHSDQFEIFFVRGLGGNFIDFLMFFCMLNFLQFRRRPWGAQMNVI